MNGTGVLDCTPADLRFRIARKLLLMAVVVGSPTNRLLYYPSLEELSKYTLRNEAALTTSLAAQWALKLANIFQYNSDPVPGIGKTDSQWLLGLQYSF